MKPTAKRSAVAKLMAQMDHRSITLASVVNHPALSSEKMEAISLLTQSVKGTASRAAVTAKLESIGVTERVVPHILDNVPEIETQKKRKVGIYSYSGAYSNPISRSSIRNRMALQSRLKSLKLHIILAYCVKI